MTHLDPMLLNLLYAAMGGAMLIIFAWMATRFFGNVMGFKVRDQLAAGNVAVGLAVLGIFMGIGIGLGIVIGLSLN